MADFNTDVVHMEEQERVRKENVERGRAALAGTTRLRNSNISRMCRCNHHHRLEQTGGNWYCRQLPH